MLLEGELLRLIKLKINEPLSNDFFCHFNFDFW